MIRGTVYEKRRAEKNPCPSCGLSFYERTLVGLVADLHGHSSGLAVCGRLRIRYRRGIRRLAPAVQPIALDDGREILIADIEVNIAGNAVHLALFAVLPHRIGTAVVGPIHPVRKPDRVVGFNIIGCVGKQGGMQSRRDQ